MKRVAFAALTLVGLAVGSYQELHPIEERLYAFCGDGGHSDGTAFVLARVQSNTGAWMGIAGRH